jgi:hypothetical protein
MREKKKKSMFDGLNMKQGMQDEHRSDQTLVDMIDVESKFEKKDGPVDLVSEIEKIEKSPETVNSLKTDSILNIN